MLNHIVLMGRLTRDPELRHTGSGIAVASFALAVDRDFKSQDGEKETDFIDIVAWRSTAEFVCRYFRKGLLVAVQGSIQTRSYQDKEGNKRKAFEIVADNVHFAESKRDSAPSQGGGYARQDSAPGPSFSNGDTGDFEEIPTDDDLPF